MERKGHGCWRSERSPLSFLVEVNMYSVSNSIIKDVGKVRLSLYFNAFNREIKATLRLLSKSLKCMVKTSGLASSRCAPPSSLVSDVISTSGPPDIDKLHQPQP